jgi:hypothetical protein
MLKEWHTRRDPIESLYLSPQIRMKSEFCKNKKIKKFVYIAELLEMQKLHY